MSRIHVIILRAAGTNCELETAHAWESVGATTEIVRINRLRKEAAMLERAQVLTVAGGFCYGDDVSAGKILAMEMRLFLSDALRSFVDRGNLVLGICNGFQVLVKTGLLPGEPFGDDAITLAFNSSARYEDRWVRLKPGSDRCRHIDGERTLAMPVAHAEGRIVVKDEHTMQALEDGGFIAFRYVGADGVEGGYPVNPNNSMGSIAGLTDATGRVLGLMPHPERNLHYTNHPAWSESDRECESDGLYFFRKAAACF